MKRPVTFGVIILSTLLVSQPAWARTRFHDLAESPRYGEKMGGMIGRGLLNALTCFVDLLVNTVNDTKAGPPFIGTLTGLAKGTGCGVLRLGSGAVDLTTFWVPGFNGFPVSDSYENCLNGSQRAAGEETQPAMEPMGYGSNAESMPEPVQPRPAPEPPKRTWTK